MVVGVWDEENVLVDHIEFAGHFPNTSAIRVTTPDYEINQLYDDHGTHVAGTIAAKGVWSEAKGMAPKSTIVSYTWDSDDLEVLDEVSTVAYTHLRAHETDSDALCRVLLEKKDRGGEQYNEREIT